MSKFLLEAKPGIDKKIRKLSQIAHDSVNIVSKKVMTSRLRNRRRVGQGQNRSVVLDESDDEDVNLGTAHLGDSLDEYEMDDSAVEEENENGPEEEEENEVQRPKRSLLPKFLVQFVENMGGLSPRWQNWIIRGFSGLTLITGFSLLVYIGPLGLLSLTYLVITSSYSELMSLASVVTKPDQRNLNHIAWYLFLCQHFYLVGPEVLDYLISSLHISYPTIASILSSIRMYHDLLSFSMYVFVFIMFVIGLNNNYIRSYAYLAWSHMSLFLLGIPAVMMNRTMFCGMIWYVMPMTVITLNDIAAYYVGFFFGKTPLTKLSPKKTVEGFVGGGIITVILGPYISHLMATPYLISSVKASDFSDFLTGQAPLFQVLTNDTPLKIFTDQEFKILGVTLAIAPFIFHAFIISLLCSVVGPFAGFFASGFKRGCKRKNFGSFIPGHGGVLDRCDCMLICAAIINVYFSTFIALDA